MSQPPDFAAVLATSALRALEARHAKAPLMERAGRSAADLAVTLVTRPGTIVVLCGPGNNGGDGFVAARVLRERFFDVAVVFAGDAARLPSDAREAHAAYLAQGGAIVAAPPAGNVALVIDALFGVGLARPLAGSHAQQVDWINAAPVPRLALDVPSGVDADTGAILGCAVQATHTITFLAWKPGLLTGAGLDCAGEVTPCDLGVDASTGLADAGQRLDWATMAVRLPAVLHRGLRGVHKGTYGTCALAGGAEGMVGAALLAGRAALASGAGRAMLDLLDAAAPRVDAVTPELMFGAAAHTPDVTAWVAGPGIGRSTTARARVAALLPLPLPLVLDADALNLLAQDDALREAVRERSAATLLTPHPKEAARLLRCDTAQVQRDRIAAAQALAQALHAHVVVKGAGSVIAHPPAAPHAARGTAARFAINATGNAGLASGGTGDVLAGIAGGLLAQGIDPALALELAVCVHGAAADALVAAGTGPVGLRASELAPVVRALLNRQPVATARASEPATIGGPVNRTIEE